MPQRKARVHKCSRAKFNKVYKAALQSATSHYRTNAYAKRRYGGKVPKPERGNLVARARAQAVAACGGAPLPGCPGEPVSIQRVRLNSGGYTTGGRYFGGGSPLFHVQSGDDVIDTHERASSRHVVKAALQKKCPGVRFTR